ncbi:MAG TPA: methyltransferase domain-containing protein [Mycobacterium sp.]|jgi:ubiquinone/menaquinone biosynthesis C-methylase UbiE
MQESDPAGQALHDWSAVAPAWDRYRERLFQQVRAVSDRLIERVDPQLGQTLLELTAGPGETGFLATSRLGTTGRLISSDFSRPMVQAAQRGAVERGLDNVECRVLDATHIDLPDNSVDGILSRFGLMLIPGQDRAIREIRRVLRPGGRCAYATWGPPDRNPWILQIVMALLQTGWKPPGDPSAPGGMFSLATTDANQSLAAVGGFSSVDVEEVTGTMRFECADDYWSFNTSVAGPVAEFVGSLADGQLRDIRAVLDPSLTPFQRDGGLELPWLSLVTSLS